MTYKLQNIGTGHTLYIVDEPTTSLHPFDIDKLLTQLIGLIDAGNTVIVVEHNMHVAATSDWIIDIGPGAGDKGGRIVMQGTPGQIAGDKQNITGRYLKKYIETPPRR